MYCVMFSFPLLAFPSLFSCFHPIFSFPPLLFHSNFCACLYTSGAWHYTSGYLIQDEDGTGLTDREIRDEVDTFMFEGHDTTSSALSFFIYNIATNLDAQERCREEVDSVMGKYGSEDKLEW